MANPHPGHTRVIPESWVPRGSGGGRRPRPAGKCIAAQTPKEEEQQFAGLRLRRRRRCFGALRLAGHLHHDKEDESANGDPTNDDADERTCAQFTAVGTAFDVADVLMVGLRRREVDRVWVARVANPAGGRVYG